MILITKKIAFGEKYEERQRRQRQPTTPKQQQQHLLLVSDRIFGLRKEGKPGERKTQPARHLAQPARPQDG